MIKSWSFQIQQTSRVQGRVFRRDINPHYRLRWFLGRWRLVFEEEGRESGISLNGYIEMTIVAVAIPLFRAVPQNSETPLTQTDSATQGIQHEVRLQREIL